MATTGKEVVEIPLGLATNGRLPRVSFRSGVPTTNTTRRRTKMPMNGGDAAATAVGVALAAAVGVGAMRYRVVFLKLPMTPAEVRWDRLRLAGGLVLMGGGSVGAVLLIALGASASESSSVSPAVMIGAGIAAGVLSWVLAAWLLAPLRECKVTRKGTLRMKVDPAFAEALRTPQGAMPAAASLNQAIAGAGTAPAWGPRGTAAGLGSAPGWGPRGSVSGPLPPPPPPPGRPGT